jgi:hypothetical protein
MPILRQLTEAEEDLAAKEELILRVAEATHHLASVLASTNAQFWHLPTDRLLRLLNTDVPTTIATFTANTMLGMQVNGSLDAIGDSRFASRAPVEPGRTDITFDGKQFTHTPSPELVITT